MKNSIIKYTGMKRGYFGIGVYRPKTETNIGTLWRSAYNFGADFIFVIGCRYKKQSSDTVKSVDHIPLFEYEDFDDFKKTYTIWMSSYLHRAEQ